MPPEPTAAPASSPAEPRADAASVAVEEKFYLVPGERLTLQPGAEFPVVVDAPARKPHWVSEADVNELVAGFENIGRVAALNFRGTLHMLQRAEEVGEGRWRYLFVPWPRHEPIRAEIRYPEDELEFLRVQALAAHQARHWLTRRLLLPLVGGLPADAQEWLTQKSGLNFYGASRINAFLTAALGLNLLIIVYLIGGFVASFSGQRVIKIDYIEYISIYVFMDGAYRLWHTSDLSSDMRNRETDEIGWLFLEAALRAFREIRRKLS
jgi:hypothetical protein